ncbi:hypothetical protein SLS58_009111 [Diplodia intermedia]|uniref:DNA replication regulator Sld3 C-terminal domain-containing protein n=1 Tax=Diplodia intermedia TaxID=856260 RepID=A0ABR3TF90_9PEZI
MVSANKHGPLAPAPPAISSSSSSAKKRKRGDDAPAALAQKSITIRPCPTLPSDRPITLTPVKLIERSQLPLSFLDVTGGSSAALPSTRLFSAHVDALERRASDHHHHHNDDDGDDDEREGEEGDVPATPKVLVTRSEADGSLCAVERVRRGVYALCKLGAWVREEDVGAVPAYAAGLPYARPLKALRREDGRHWWQRVAVAAAPPVVGTARGDGHAPPPPRISMRRSVPNIVQQGAPPPRRLEEADPFVDSAAEQVPLAAGQPPVEGVEERPPQTAEEVFQAVVHQYLEALYLTKTSLAFFVKGPMSRARAAFTSKENTGLKMGDLAAFMRSILLQPGPMDKKHREKLPEIVKSMPLPGLSDDEDAVAAKVDKKKKNKRKKLKPNKDGLYPGEDEHVKKWWLQDRPGSSPHGHSESPADVLKRRLGDLRVRESMAQTILVLEIIALEASPSFQATEQEETQQNETPAEPQAASVKKRKSKKPQDLNVLLDLLLDRLCIWQSVEQDETLVKVPKSGSGKNDTLTPSSGKSETSDKLKNFCVEVILPFYMSRLPERAAAINKRLGGPSASPAKTSGSASSTHRSKPGEAAVRTDPRAAQKKRRPLARVATENAAAHQPPRHPSLTRSSTDPLLLPPNLKREGSDAPSLSSIPLQQKETSQTSSSRNSLSQFERFSRRTIDLDAMSKSNEAKLRKKAHVERELEKAIGTLRKPNRGAALKDVADTADSRRQAQASSSSSSSSRGNGGGGGVSKPRVPVTRKAGGGNNTVLVGATPKRGRKTKDIVLQAATPNHDRFVTTTAAAAVSDHPDGDDIDADVAPPSDPVIPSSAVRPGPVDFLAPGGFGYVPASAVKNNNNNTSSSLLAPSYPSSHSFSTAAAAAAAARGGGGGGGAVEETPSRGPAGKTVHWFFPPTAGGGSGGSGSGDNGGAAAPVGATPEGRASGVSRLGEKLKASSAAGAKFKLPGEPVSRMSIALGMGEVEEEGSEESEDELTGVAALMRTPTKPRRRGGGQVLQTPVKRAGAGAGAGAVVGETPVKVKDATADVEVGVGVGVRENKGKQKEVGVEVEVEEGGLGRIEEEDGAEDIYNALGWDDDIDELA